MDITLEQNIQKEHFEFYSFGRVEPVLFTTKLPGIKQSTLSLSFEVGPSGEFGNIVVHFFSRSKPSKTPADDEESMLTELAHILAARLVGNLAKNKKHYIELSPPRILRSPFVQLAKSDTVACYQFQNHSISLSFVNKQTGTA